MTPRPQLWWDTFCNCQDDAYWKAHFRMTLGTFDLIVEAVKPYMERNNTHYRKVTQYLQ